MTRYTLDEATNALSPDQRVYILEIEAGGRAGYLNSTLQFLVEDPNNAGSWPFNSAHNIIQALTKGRVKPRQLLVEPVPATVTASLDAYALVAAINAVPPDHQWLLRSDKTGSFFAHVSSNDYTPYIDAKGNAGSIGGSFKAVADTPQDALAGAVRQARR